MPRFLQSATRRFLRPHLLGFRVFCGVSIAYRAAGLPLPCWSSELVPLSWKNVLPSDLRVEGENGETPTPTKNSLPHFPRDYTSFLCATNACQLQRARSAFLPSLWSL